VGITGPPGVGKSTFIEAFGTQLTSQSLRVAVLAVDPTSSVSGGSILGDKTRMQSLSVDPRAFVRPSPSGGNLGGVARRTRETMLLCEAAGYDVILVETVGVGQSETLVAGMVDFFVALMLPGAGDELQGIKKGILELADLIAVNKADGDNRPRAELARREYASALRYLTPIDSFWSPPVRTCSGTTGEGLDAIWNDVVQHREMAQTHGRFDERRREQRIAWFKQLLNAEVLESFYRKPGKRESVDRAVEAVADQTQTPLQAMRSVFASP
jgi:LAO/AO transport system kinase